MYEPLVQPNTGTAPDDLAHKDVGVKMAFYQTGCTAILDKTDSGLDRGHFAVRINNFNNCGIPANCCRISGNLVSFTDENWLGKASSKCIAGSFQIGPSRCSYKSHRTRFDILSQRNKIRWTFYTRRSEKRTSILPISTGCHSHSPFGASLEFPIFTKLVPTIYIEFARNMKLSTASVNARIGNSFGEKLDVLPIR